MTNRLIEPDYKTVESFDELYHHDEHLDAKGWDSTDSLIDVLDDLQRLLKTFEIWLPHALTLAEQRALLGSGSRRHGFLDKISDLAAANPQFFPDSFKPADFKEKVKEIEIFRDISADLNQMQQIIDDLLLISGNDAFRMAQSYYNSVREASHNNVPDAEQLLRVLSQFFRRSRRTLEKYKQMPVLEE